MYFERTKRWVVTIIKHQGTRQVTPFPVPSTWQVYTYSGRRPNTTGIMQMTSMRNNQFAGSINFRGVPSPLTGSWNPANNSIQFESPYVSFQGVLTATADATARYWSIQGTYLSKVGSDYPGARGTFVATTSVFNFT